MSHSCQRAFWSIAALLTLAASPGAFAQEPANTSATLTGDAACTRCHDESETKPILALYKTRHGVKADQRTPGCQSCHGASEAHILNTGGTGAKRTLPDVTFGVRGKSDAKQQAGTCLGCHEGANRALWLGSQHESRDIPCAGCHSVHAAADPVLTKLSQPDVCYGCHKSQRAQAHLLSTHPLAAAKMACADCHNPHGSTTDHLLSKPSVNDTCFTCHAEKRGPFLWEHAPVADDCTNCHTPHGSTVAPLLKARVPWLCQDCHSGDHANAVNSGANLQDGAVTTAGGRNPLANSAARGQLAARACLNCHVLVHGSNHPAGSKFQR